ncbi:condensation domain-containing protein [Streptomyces sp. uw30]|uniref:condensation domain-containing protein n=1 Tax=Streptomyces sp. uw30 TaxID=1828179 RepID=UPI0021CAD87E|nr:condensation domain-containing protein [Streptomyces sp. uw30]
MSGASPAIGDPPTGSGDRPRTGACPTGAGDRGASYAMSDVRRVEGAIDAERLARAIDRVAARHEAMRIGFEEDGTAQNCVERATPMLSTTTLCDAAPGEVEALLSRFAQRPVDMVSPSLFRFQLIQTGEAAYLQATAPHAVVDGWSFEVLWAELSSFYLGSEEDGAVREPASFLEFARSKRKEEDARFEANEALWRPRLDRVWQSSGRMIDGAQPFAPVTRVDHLPQGPLAGLRELSRSSRSTMNTAALSAVAVASSLLMAAPRAIVMASRTGQPAFCPGKSLIGFCVDLLPVIVELPDDSTLMDVTRDVQQQLVAGADTVSGLYQVLPERRYRQRPAIFLAFEYSEEIPGTLFGAPATPLSLPHERIPHPALITVEKHSDGIEIISAVSQESALAPYAADLAVRVEQILADPTVPLGELRRR